MGNFISWLTENSPGQDDSIGEARATQPQSLSGKSHMEEAVVNNSWSL